MMNSHEFVDLSPPPRRNIFVAIEEPQWIKAPPASRTKPVMNLELSLNIIRNTPPLQEDILNSVPMLLERYPKLKFDQEDPESVDLWRDIVKASAPKNMKNKLRFEPAVFDVLMTAELQRALLTRNTLRHAMTVMGEACNKVNLLKIVGQLEGCPQAYCLGSGSRPDTRRLIMMYEVEAKVTPRRRVSKRQKSLIPAHFGEVTPSPPTKKKRTTRRKVDREDDDDDDNSCSPKVSTWSANIVSRSSSSSHHGRSMFVTPDCNNSMYVSPNRVNDVHTIDMSAMYHQLQFSDDGMMQDSFACIPFYDSSEDSYDLPAILEDIQEEPERCSSADFFLDLNLDDELAEPDIHDLPDLSDSEF